MPYQNLAALWCGSDKRYPAGLQVKVRDPPAMVEPGGAMALDLRLNVRPPGHQLGGRFWQRGSQNLFDLVERQLDLCCRRRLVAKPLVQRTILGELGLFCHNGYFQIYSNCSPSILPTSEAFILVRQGASRRPTLCVGSQVNRYSLVLSTLFPINVLRLMAMSAIQPVPD